MKSRLRKRLLAGCLSVILMLQAGSTSAVFALEDTYAKDSRVFCTAHPIHDMKCGYAQGSNAIERVPGTECAAVHEDDDIHDDTCGYTAEIPAVEAVSESPCLHSCDICTERDFGVLPLTKPIQLPSRGSDVTGTMQNVSSTVSQGGNDITGGDSLNPTDPIRITVSFDVPDDSINEGDTASFQLSTGLTIGNAINGPLFHNGEEVGVIQFSLDTGTGITTAMITFSELVDDLGTTDITVNFFADMQYNKSGNAGNAGDHTIQILGKDYTVVVPEKVTTITVVKDGTADVTNKVVDWKVRVDPVVEGTPTGSLALCSFADNLADVGKYVTDSFQIGDTENSITMPTTPPNYDPATKILTYYFLDNDSGTKYITFQTEIPQDKLDGNGKQTITNTAGVTTTRPNVHTTDGTGKTEFTMTWIEKNGKPIVGTKPDGSYDPENQKIEWSIIANHNGASLTNTVITDKLPQGLTWESAKLQIWDNGTNAWVPSSTIFTTAPASGEYIIGNVATKILLTIITKVDDKAPPSKITHYENTATIKWNGLAGDGYKSTPVTVGIGFAPISKNASGYTTSDHTIDWSVNIDAQKQNYGADLRIMDLLVYKESGFNINDTYSISDNNKDNLFDVGAEDLKKLTPQYNQKYKGDFTSVGGLGITVHTLEKNGIPVADLLVVAKSDGTGIDNTNQNSFTYKSIVTNPQFYAANYTFTINNTASLFSSNVEISHATALQKCRSDMLHKDMLPVGFTDNDVTDFAKLNGKAAAKEKAFNYLDKSIYFRIHVNANRLTDATNDITTVHGEKLGNLLVADTLPEGWQFQPINGKDFLLFEGTQSSTAGLVTAVKAVPEADYPAIFTGGIPVLPTETKGGQLSFTFTSLTKPYVILIKACPTDAKAVQYFNTNGTHTITNRVDISAGTIMQDKDEVSASIKSELVSKTLDQAHAEAEGYLSWNVEYRPYDLAHTDTYIEDTIPVGIDLRTNSKGELILKDHINITELVLNQDGSYTVGAVLDTGVVEKNLSYNTKTRTLCFQIPNTSKAYRLTYITDVTGTTGTIKNKASLSGGAIPPVGAEDQKNYTITSASSGASFQRSGWLLVTKQDDAGVPLGGAEFTLFSENGTTMIRQGTSANDGKIYLKVLPEGDYILKETAAPSGYVLDGQQYIVTVTKDAAGKFITSVNKQTGNSSHEITVKNHKTSTIGSLQIEKKVRGNAGEEGRKFKFTITLSDTVNSYAYVGNGVPDGTIKNGDVILLAHHQSITVIGLPKDVTYHVTEQDYSADGYTVTKTGDSGTIAADNTQTASFTNTKNIDSGVGSNPGSGYLGESNTNNSQQQPKPTAPQTEYQSYTINSVPNPNLPDSPDKIMVMDENNMVIGIYIKTAMPDGTFAYISDEGVVLNDLGNPQTGHLQNGHPQTGNAMPVELLIFLFFASICSAGMLVLYQRDRRTK